MRKFIFITIIIIITITIYNIGINNNKTILILGDNILNNIEENILKEKYDNYINISRSNDYRVMDLINSINNNEKVNYNNKQYSIQNLLVKSDTVILSIGLNDLLYLNDKEDYNYIDSLVEDLDKLFLILRKYNKEKIYITNYYEDSNIKCYINIKLDELVNKYDINIINIKTININNRNITQNEYKKINKKIYTSLLIK